MGCENWGPVSVSAVSDVLCLASHIAFHTGRGRSHELQFLQGLSPLEILISHEFTKSL